TPTWPSSCRGAAPSASTCSASVGCSERKTTSAPSSTSWSRGTRRSLSPASDAGRTVLTADLVHARATGGELTLLPLTPARRARAHLLAGELLAAAAASVGATREELDAALGAVDAGPREARLKAALAKLVVDACDLEEDASAPPEVLRHALFRR